VLLLGSFWQTFNRVTAFTGIGLLIAVGLLVLNRFLLPEQAQKKARPAVALLVLHLVFLLLRLLAPSGWSGDKTLAWLSLLFLLLTIGRSAFLLLVDTLLGDRLARPMPKIFRDILQGLVYIAVFLVTLRAAGVEPSSLLTTSALLTAVIGLSLQETLGNLFAGLAIQAQTPFEVGDWIQFDEISTHIGQVVEINWRATKIVTLDLVEITVPNGTLAKAPIRNYTKPTPIARRTAEVLCSYEIPPHRVQQTILNAIREMPHVLQDPKPCVLNMRLDDSGITYQVCYFINEFNIRNIIESSIRDRIWYALKRENIPIPFPMRTIHMHEVSDDTLAKDERMRLQRRVQTLQFVDFLNILPDSDLHRLAAVAESRIYADGEIIIRQGEKGDDFFIIETGMVSVLVGRPGGSTAEVARLGSGKFFGEMSLMTGEQRTATVCTNGSCELLVLRKKDFQPILNESPELAERISKVIVMRQEAIEANVASRSVRNMSETDQRSGLLLNRIIDFFALKGNRDGPRSEKPRSGPRSAD
jgi:small-conductance mechanosensitive channel/CRP-like cAMP-binding protein